MQPETVSAAMRGVDRVYHTAAKVEIGATSDAGMTDLNVQGTRHILESAWRWGVERVVYTSTVGVIGACSTPLRLSEQQVYSGRGTRLPYTYSKLLADRLMMRYVRRGLPVVPVYPTLFMGPGDKYLNATRPVLRYMEGRARGYIAGGFGCTDVRDVARGHLMAMQRGQLGRRYILGGWNVTVREFYGLLEQITRIPAPNLRLPASLVYLIAAVTRWIEPIRGKPPVITCGDIESARLYWFYDYERARDELGLECRPLIETLRDTVDWLRQRFFKPANESRVARPHLFDRARDTEPEIEGVICARE
jgi:dihydroflavonol-4-reductase